ncbi:MAG TPA: ATP-binding cassette domain-containing protein [Terracidiphilus sp.]|nr:ATP-binding cassette domain-containing protein [Terracidiphilus sp.]
MIAPPESRSPILSLRDVCYSYPSATGRKQVLRNVSADIWPGEIVLMVGPSGAGKTTMLTLAGALRSVESGSLISLKRELSGASPEELMRVRRKIGFIFQRHNLLKSLSALDNVRTALQPLDYPYAEEREACVAMLQAVGLGAYLHSRPNNLSGGQQQRVAIARALVRKPELVLADEPTASLDGASGREIVELLRQLARAQGCTIVLVTHDSRILDLADRCLRLEDGILSSYASAVTADSAHMLTALSAFRDSEELGWFWSRMDAGQFLDALRKLRVEATQFLNVMDFGADNSLAEWVDSLLFSVLAKVAALLDVPSARIRTIGESQLGGISLSIGSPQNSEPLTLEIRDRHADLIGMAEFWTSGGIAFTEASQRRLWDFEKVFGLLLEICIRTKRIEAAK